MLGSFRDDFNARFTPEAYGALRQRLSGITRTEIAFPVAETPVFFPRALLDEMIEAGHALTDQLLGNPEYLKASRAAIPAPYRTAGESPHPHFMTADFGLALDSSGRLAPKLVELQAFPSVFGFQAELAGQYVESFALSGELGWFFGGHDERSYWEVLREVIVGQHAPEQVILVDVEPAGQKTLPDFRVYQDRLGVATVDIAKLRREGDRLFYRPEDADGGVRSGRAAGAWIPVERIFNRAIADEIERKQVQLPFDLRDPLRMEWAGHPNWYFRISKFSLPWLRHPCVPAAVFLDEWLEDAPGGPARSRVPEDPERILLKPLYSFAGTGIQFAPSAQDLGRIPPAERGNYLLQERIDFHPVVRPPFGPTQTEVRILYVWRDGRDRMEPLLSLARLGRGRMMGVDHNRAQSWVGASAVLFP